MGAVEAARFRYDLSLTKQSTASKPGEFRSREARTVVFYRQAHSPGYGYAMKTYQEKLKDPRWQECRERILERDGYECKKCGGFNILQVHHKEYKTHTSDPWDYPDDVLITLCKKCHSSLHLKEEIRSTERLIQSAPLQKCIPKKPLPEEIKRNDAKIDKMVNLLSGCFQVGVARK